MMRTLYLIAGLAALGVPFAALSHQGAQGVVKMRMEAMESVATSTKKLGNMQKTGVIDTRAAAAAAQNLSVHAAAIGELFEEQNIQAPSEARPEIWDNWEDFLAKADAMGQAAEVLKTAGDDPAAFAAGMQALGQSCTACHQAYRVKK